MKSSVVLGAVVAALLSSGSVMAADLAAPPAAIVSPVPAANDWTGFYLGVFGGLGASSHDFSINPPAPTPAINATISGNGGFGGVQAGYNFDLGGAVLGVSADLALANIGASINVSGLGGGANASSTIDYFGTVQGRVGLPLDNLLIYAHGGYAYSHEKQTVTGLTPTAINLDQNRSGYVIGAGIDYAINQNLSLETEYSYYSFGSATVASDILGPGTNLNEQTSFHALKAGLNYKF